MDNKNNVEDNEVKDLTEKTKEELESVKEDIEIKKEETEVKLEDLDEKAEGVKEKVEEDLSKEMKKADKKNTEYIIAAAVACIVLILLVAVNTNKSKTYKLSSVYPSYFAESEGEVKLPKNWLYSEEGQLFKNENGKVTLMGQILGAELSEDDYNATIESLSYYYELNEISKNGIDGYYIHTSSDNDTFDIYILFKDSTYVQIGLMNAEEADANLIIDSLKF